MSQFVMPGVKVKAAVNHRTKILFLRCLSDEMFIHYRFLIFDYLGPFLLTFRNVAIDNVAIGCCFSKSNCLNQ